MRGRGWLAAGAVAGALMIGASPAWAMDCFIANRSAQGNLQAGTNSKAWTIFPVYGFFVSSPPDGLGLSPSCATGAVAAVAAAGLPTSFTVRSNTIIGENSSNPNLGNGKGLDHLDQSPIAGAVVAVAMNYVSTHSC